MLHARLTDGRITEDWALRLFAGPRLRLTIQETDQVEVQIFKAEDGSVICKTVDGEIFDTEAEAKAHASALLAEAEIDKFIASQEYKRGQGTHAKNVLMKFSAWKNGG